MKDINYSKLAEMYNCPKKKVGENWMKDMGKHGGGTIPLNYVSFHMFMQAKLQSVSFGPGWRDLGAGVSSATNQLSGLGPVLSLRPSVSLLVKRRRTMK